MADVKVGDNRSLVLVDDLSRTQIVQYAGASGDYNPLHTDDRFTTEVAGYPSVFAHGMLTMGMTGRVLTDWFGAEAADRVRRAVRQAGVAGRHAHGDRHRHRRPGHRRRAARRPHDRDPQPGRRHRTHRRGDRPPLLTGARRTRETANCGPSPRHHHRGTTI